MTKLLGNFDKQNASIIMLGLLIRHLFVFCFSEQKENLILYKKPKVALLFHRHMQLFSIACTDCVAVNYGLPKSSYEKASFSLIIILLDFNH